MYDVLIVDDESIILEGLKNVINWDDFGLEIKDSARNGSDALKLLKQNHYDILIADVHMKDISGLELLRIVSEEKIPVKSIILSGYDKFDYVKEAISLGIENYLLKPVNEDELAATLINTIEKLNQEGVTRELFSIGSNVLFDSVIYRWLTSSIEYDEFMSRADLLGIVTSRKHYAVCIVKYYKPRNNDSDTLPYTPVRELKKAAEGQELAENGTVDIYTALCPNKNVLILIASDACLETSDIKNKLNKLLKELKQSIETDMDFFACIGEPAIGWENAGKSYESAVKMLSYAFIMPLNSVIAYGDMQNDQYSLYLQHKSSLKAMDSLLSSLLDEHIEEQCVSIIKAVFGDIKSGAAVSPEELYSFIAEMVFRFFGTLQIKDVGGAPEGGGDDVLNMILKMQTVDEIEDWLISIIREHIASKNGRNPAANNIVRKLIKHVEMFYHEDISLKTLSYEFSLNPSYLGQIFKDGTGMLFTDYLCNIRIDHAKKLLIESNMKTGEISSKVGFRNANYFSNVFKKKTGCHPTMYRAEYSG